MADQKRQSLENCLLSAFSVAIVLVTSFCWAQIISENKSGKDSFVESQDNKQTMNTIRKNVMVFSGNSLINDQSPEPSHQKPACGINSPIWLILWYFNYFLIHKTAFWRLSESLLLGPIFSEK
ncbi:MAG: hypothetical protein WD555_05270 [Fulvivirga sp.]